MTQTLTSIYIYTNLHNSLLSYRAVRLNKREEKTEETTKNGQSRDSGNTSCVHNRERRQTNKNATQKIKTRTPPKGRW